jgi:ubiquinone/menaquinone biosynthesis C-methylase UbiE
MTQISREALNQAITAVGAAIAKADPHGKAHGLRTLLTYGLYKLFDDLRGQERAFDREAFLHGLNRAKAMAETHPVIDQTSAAALPEETIEAFTADLYSRCWTYYTDEQFLDMAKLFDKRFVKSGITLDLKGKKCIDLGCGSGRYTIAMADAGASESWGFDLSYFAISEATKRAARLNYGNCHFQAGSVLELPFEDESFDFVSCNGVLHHTTDPKQGLAELARITRKDGVAYVMLYGSGELWWDLTDMMREVMMENVPRNYAFSALELLGVAPGKIFNYMDHMFVPCREVISHAEFQDRLRAVGFKSWEIMERGEMIDSAERKFLFPEDADLVGEADLRYVCRF